MFRHPLNTLYLIGQYISITVLIMNKRDCRQAAWPKNLFSMLCSSPFLHHHASLMFFLQLLHNRELSTEQSAFPDAGRINARRADEEDQHLPNPYSIPGGFLFFQYAADKAYSSYPINISRNSLSIPNSCRCRNKIGKKIPDN